ncbi:plasmid transfer ATPase TraJ [Salmonella enterica subsp. enterica serovar Bredeney]|uniref:Plasmid transfer ATPase TraJ n=2 Tax=Salmonella enterica TaxID=28901 RepID=A0A5T6J8A2_SALER|nr:plasmid transfer ATPase TraJ [Salmonella enterica]EDQ4280651.1 plasmid transfer ATPase TraJ [Salmonella enterica subsp. enterica serovar Bredeney]EAO9101765.1 plasmid transfer ATPase TraJ [Salmonella enterica]EAP2764990.1 plasmid transfer ATPase TraJ [Salmonella enterica]EBJ2155160.1 hypothetical protein [Salmonella enterica]
MTWLDRQWINPVPLSRITREKKAIAPDCYITQARKGEITLQELGQRITAVCGLPVIITPDATSATLEGGVTRQMTGTLPTPDENGRLPLNSPGYTSLSASSQPLTLNNLMWQGDINGLLDLMASRSGLYWRMDNGRIVFYLTETRTYPLYMLNTKTSSSSSVSSGSTSTMGATGGQDNSASGDATSSQSTTVGQEYDLYEDIRKTIEAMLTPEKGRYWLSASSSTLTVTDTPAVQEAVARYVDEQNSIMNRQVSLNVQVLSVSHTRNEQFGLDWNLVYKSLHSAGATLNNASGDITGATSAGVSILDTATGNAARFSGSSLLIKALSEQGDVSVVTSQESTVTNLTPVPIQMADQTVYVAQSATTTTTDVGATTTLTPGMITTGFNMTLLPLIQKTGNLQLQMNFNLSDPPTIRSFTSKDGNSYIEMPYKRGERVRLRSHLIQGTSGAEEKAISITMRVIPTAIPDIRTMNIEPDLLAAMVSKNGLGFVCGETGSGKSTLCAALYRYIMDNFPDRKIVTYEDPVEYILGREGDLLPPHQAEIGRDVVSFAAGLRSAVRRNPEIIGVGEIRDNETADAAVQAGNTGHLCLSTMHTKSPGETLSRLLGLFPSIIRDAMAWSVLSLLQFILVQVLVRTNDGGRRAVREYIVIDDELRNKLTRMPHSEWGYHIDEIIRTEKRRIRDYVLEMYIKGEIDRSEAVIFIPPGEMRQ